MNKALGSLLVAVSLVAAVGLLGYLTGHHKAGAAVDPRWSAISSSALTIQHPGAWQPTAAVHGLPGLSFSERPVALSPQGETDRAGLLAGRLAHTATSPLPAAFVASLRASVNPEVVSLGEVEAFRYRNVKLAGSEDLLTLYSIPAALGDSTAVACYAAPAYASYLRECDQMAAALVIHTPVASAVLVPSAVYAKQLHTALGPLDALRVGLRAQLTGRATPARVAKLARALAEGFQRPLTTLASAQPPATARSMQLTLIDALTSTRSAYLALAEAASEHNRGGYAAARRAVGTNEARLADALGELRLIGY